MQQTRITLLLGLTLLLAGGTVAAGNSGGSQEQAEDIWEDVPRPQYPWWYRWLSDDATVERILKGIRERDPAKAKELEGLRQKDAERFKAELGMHGSKEIQDISRERFEANRRRWQEEFLKWLKANYPKDEEDLARVKEKDPQLYVRMLERLEDQFGPIFDALTTNPELGTVLKEDFDLKRRRDELLRRLRRERSDARKQEIGAELQEVVARRYDLIVRRKEIAYEQLQKKLDDLHRQIRESKNEIVRWQDPEVKGKNVRERLQALTQDEKRVRFSWN
jgi:sulfite reductase alpha subunit-like flavoprotein